MRFHKLEESILNKNAIIGLCEAQEHGHAASRLAQLLRQSQKFYCGELRELPKMKDYSQYPLLPFPTICLEYDGDAYADFRLSHFCLAWGGESPSEPDLSMLFFWRYPEAIAFSGAAIFDRKSAALQIKNPIDMRSPELIDEGQALLRNHFERIGDFLAVLNCVNVKTQIEEAPTALNKKRIKNGKPPVYAYKTLVLRPSPAQRADQGGAHDSPRIHLRRGHIKHRKTGDFWWQPCVVGDRTRGVVMKDYRADKLTAPSCTS
jgi:hypothetical protein